jgi:hypothetical protein
MTNKQLQEDTVSADRKERIIYVGPGKTRKISSITSRQNFDNEKFTRKSDKETDDKEEVKESAVQPTGTSQIDVGATERAVDSQSETKKKDSGQIKFVTGNQQVTSATAIGNAQNVGIKKISEAIVKKAMTQIKVDKNVGTEEIPFDGPYTKSSSDVVDKSGAHHTASSRARHLARKAMNNQMKKEEVEIEEGLQQTLRKVVPGYAKRQIDKKMDAEKFGRTDADRDANYWRYKKVQDKLKKEEVELEEKLDLSKTEMGDVVKDFQQSDAPQFQGKSKEKRREMAIAAKLQADRVKKEETTMSKTYAEFIEQLNEYNAKDGVYRHKGSYGGGYDSNDDEDEDAPKKPAAPAVKRGRGRPAGSKSGANQKVTTGKSYGGIATHSLHLPNSK